MAQEVCLALLSALPSYRDMGRPFGAFVFAIAAHKVAQAARAPPMTAERPSSGHSAPAIPGLNRMDTFPLPLPVKVP